MSGHHPFSNLTKNFSPERRRRIKAMADELCADIERREALETKADRNAPNKAKQPHPAKQQPPNPSAAATTPR